MTVAAVEVQARRYLRLFPAWMRTDRGEEAVSLVLDQLPADAERLPVRSKVDLVRAGLHARRRGTPPVRVRRIVLRTPSKWVGDAGAVPVEWRPWLISALQTRTLEWRCAFTGNPYGLVAFAPMVISYPSWLWITIAFAACLWLVNGVGWFVFRRRTWRQRVLMANGLGDDGRPLPPGEVAVIWTRAVIDNVWIVPGAIAAATGAVAGTPISWLALRSGAPARVLDGDPMVALGLVAVVSCAAAWWTSRQVRRARGPEPTPATPPVVERTTPFVGCIAAGLSLGGIAAFGAVSAALSLGWHAGALAAVPLAGATLLAVVLGAERRVGRRIGLWEVRPWLAPQRIVRRVRDLPPPPAEPDRPAFG